MTVTTKRNRDGTVTIFVYGRQLLTVSSDEALAEFGMELVR